MYRTTAHPYRSFAASCTLHLISALLCLYTLPQQPQSMHDLHKSQAPVTLYTPPVPQEPPKAAPPIKQEAAQAPMLPPLLQEAQSAPEGPAGGPIVQPRPFYSPETPQDTGDADEPQPEEQTAAVEQNSPPIIPISKESASPSKEGFMEVFKQAIAQERHDKEAQRSAQVPEHVHTRLEEWKQYHYTQKILAAIEVAGSCSTKTMSHHQTVDRHVVLTIPIMKDGSLGDLSQYPMSGIYEVDRYLMRILAMADFPPIPERFKTNVYLFRLPLHVSLRKGEETYRLHFLSSIMPGNVLDQVDVRQKLA